MNISVSEHLPDSVTGYQTIHNISVAGKTIGHVNIEYVTEEDAKAFKKSKRKLRMGQAFKARIFIETSKTGIKASDLGKEGFKEIVEIIKDRFRGLEDKDIGVIELYEDHKNIIGCVTSL